ncbi:MAG: hypothetical protein QM754_00240 [Tepidisphaeraceae bacterium]
MSLSSTFSREADFVSWLRDFCKNLTTQPANYFGVDEDAIQDYTAIATAYLNAYATASNPNTRTPPNIAAKDLAKKSAVTATRSIVDVIQAWPQMTDEKRRLLDITIRKKRKSIPRPSLKPYLEIAGVDQNTISVRITQSKTEKAKPDGVIGATLFSAVGPTPPTSESGWFSQGNTTKNVVQVQFPDTVPPGSRVWFTAVYYSRKAETGPAANVIGTNLPGGAAFGKAA